MKTRKLFIALLLSVTIIAAAPVGVVAEPEITAAAYILIDADTGAVLRAHNEHQRIYPASMMKILTAMLLVEHLGLDEIFIIGDEINDMPAGSSSVNHSVGDAISGENMLRSIMMPSGNDTAITAALQIALRAGGVETMSFGAAEFAFANLMNARAREIGAVNSNFVNPHGFHHPNQFTTAYDLALIARRAMQYEDIARIARESFFVGPSAVSDDPAHTIVNFSWRTHNQLLHPGQPYYFRYATGLRTGWHDQAGPSVIASASRDGVNLIAVISNSPNVTNEDGTRQEFRWIDARNLLEYGLNNFTHQTLAGQNTLLGSVAILGQEPINFMAAVEVPAVLRVGELPRVERRFEFDQTLLASAADEEPMLLPPITEGATIGTAAFYLDGARIAQTPILAAQSTVQQAEAPEPHAPHAPQAPQPNEPAPENGEPTLLYQIFSLRALPFWLAGVALLLIIIFIIAKISAHNKWRNDYRL